MVAAMMVCGGAVLLALGLLGLFKAQQESAENLPTGDLRALLTPTRDDGQGISGARVVPTDQGEALLRATATPAGHEPVLPAATTTALPDVAPPMRMVIEEIGINAPIITLGLDTNSLPKVPNDPYVVAWYDFSAKPGQGSNAVFAGHVDWTVNGQPVTGVFWGLRELDEGDIVRIILEDGSELRYRVTHSAAVEHNDPDGVKVMYPTPNDVITLISCGGTWVPNASNPLGGNYTHRTVVRAERVT